MDPNEYLRRRQVSHESCNSDTEKKIDAPEDSYNIGTDMLRNTQDANNSQYFAENPSIVNTVQVVADIPVSENIEKCGAKNIRSDKTVDHVAENPNSVNTLLQMAKNSSNDNTVQNVMNSSGADIMDNENGGLSVEKKSPYTASDKNEQSETDNRAAFNRDKDQLGVAAVNGSARYLESTGKDCTTKAIIEHSNRDSDRHYEVENPKSLQKEKCQVSQNNLQGLLNNPVDINTGQDENNNPIGTNLDLSCQNPQTSQNLHTAAQNDILRLTKTLLNNASVLIKLIERDRQELLCLQENFIDEPNVPGDVNRRLQTIQYYNNRSTFLIGRIVRYYALTETVIQEIENRENEPSQFARRVRLLDMITEECKLYMETSEENEINQDDSSVPDNVLFELCFADSVAGGMILLLILVFINYLLQTVTR